MGGADHGAEMGSQAQCFVMTTPAQVRRGLDSWGFADHIAVHVFFGHSSL